MSTIILNTAIIPRKPTKYYNFSTFERKLASKLMLRISSTTPSAATRLINPCSLRCIAAPYNDQIATTRRSGNYNPTLWDSHDIQSLNSQYKDDRYLKKASELVQQVGALLEEDMEYVRRLELIDNLHKLGISYHFDNKIKQILNRMHQDHQHKYLEKELRDLYSTALEFRLLRQYGFSVPQEVFDCFKNEKGVFEPNLAEDTKGLLQLYEACFLLIEGEKTLEIAREFSTNFLQKKLDDDHGIDDDHLSSMVRNALELPLHWRIQRLNARWFIDAYGREPDMNPIVLELAKLDFNILQATYQEEIKSSSRWWEQTSLARKLPFARNRLVECFLWALGEIFQPQYGYARIMNTKANILITILDDMFDVYGTLEELQLFNDIIQRWDIDAVDQLPDYMQILFLAINNFIYEMAYEVLKEQGCLIIPYLRKSWTDLCSRYIKEATWYSKGYTPTLTEYIENAWISIGPPLMLCHEFFLVTNPIEKEAVESLYKYHNIIRLSSTIVRLSNDLGTSPDEMERGDVPKSIQCYMNETGANDEEAREYIRFLIHEAWKKMNEELQVADSPFSQDYVRSVADLGRFGQYLYIDGDGHGVQTLEIKNRISSVLFEPIV